MEKMSSSTRKDPSPMHPTTPAPVGASSDFVAEFNAYVRRWISRQQSEQACVTREPAGPGRPCE
jgi:hypothetical protein